MNLSFTDCPNKCVDGYYVNPYSHRREICPHCAGKRREIVKTGSTDIIEQLNLPRSFTGDKYDPDTIILASERKSFEEDSLTKVFEYLNTLYTDVTAGESPDTSMLFNLGKKAFEQNFIHPFMLRAYQAGLTVSPYVSEYDVRQLYNGVEKHMGELTYADLLKTDICVVGIGAGATGENIYAVKGLMEHRAHYNHSTIIFTNAWGEKIIDLCTDGEVFAKNLAFLAELKYKTKYANANQDKPMYQNTMTSAEFKNLLGRN